MQISASIESSLDRHNVTVKTNDNSKQLNIPPKSTGLGSSVNGGEFLLLSIATCFCNDIYREAAKRNLTISNVEIVCTGEFEEGEPGSNFTYKVNVISDAPAHEIEDLVKYTDKIAEIHNTLRQGLAITLTS